MADEFRSTGANLSLWRSSSSVESRTGGDGALGRIEPRDLRDYGDDAPSCAARERTAGAAWTWVSNAQRTLGTTIGVAPAQDFWVRRRVGAPRQAYMMLRDPTHPGVIAPGGGGTPPGQSIRELAGCRRRLPFSTSPAWAAAVPEGAWERSVTRFLGAIDASIIGCDQLQRLRCRAAHLDGRYQFGLDEFEAIRRIGRTGRVGRAGTRYSASKPPCRSAQPSRSVFNALTRVTSRVALSMS